VCEGLPVHLVIQERLEFVGPVVRMVQPVQLVPVEPPVHLVLPERLDLWVALEVPEQLGSQDPLDQQDSKE